MRRSCQSTRSGSVRCSSTSPTPPLLWGELEGEREPGRPRWLRSGCRSGGGRGGAAPTGKKSEGGWVGQSGPAGYPRVNRSSLRVLVRDGGVGGAAPRRRHAIGLGAPSPSHSPARGEGAGLPSMAALGRGAPHPRPLPRGEREPEPARLVSEARCAPFRRRFARVSSGRGSRKGRSFSLPRGRHYVRGVAFILLTSMRSPVLANDRRLRGAGRIAAWL